MKVVDAALERDGEVEQVLLSAPENHRLGRSNARESSPEEEGDAERDRRRRARRDRQRERGAHASEKMTGYSAVLLVVRVSPGTGSTSTLTETVSPNGTSVPTSNDSGTISPGSMSGIVLVWMIGSGVLGIVSVTLIWTSCESPLFSTPTSNASSSVTSSVVSVVVESWSPLGRAFT